MSEINGKVPNGNCPPHRIIHTPVPIMGCATFQDTSFFSQCTDASGAVVELGCSSLSEGGGVCMSITCALCLSIQITESVRDWPPYQLKFHYSWVAEGNHGNRLIGSLWKLNNREKKILDEYSLGAYISDPYLLKHWVFYFILFYFFLWPKPWLMIVKFHLFYMF